MVIVLSTRYNVPSTKYCFKFEVRDTKYGNKIMLNAERRLKNEEVDTRYKVPSME